MDLSLIEKLVQLAMVMMAILIASNLYVRSQILNLLREHHEDVWKELGSPTLVQNNNFENGVATLRFIWGHGQRSLNDPALEQLMRMERRLHVIQGIVLLLAILLMVSTLFLR